MMKGQLVAVEGAWFRFKHNNAWFRFKHHNIAPLVSRCLVMLIIKKI